ncbi:unnamed protein product [Heterobilharzia americana]|nr:unnamed protein product [Heterobilharzia americana]
MLLWTLCMVLFFHSKISGTTNPWYGCPQDENLDTNCPDGWFSFEANCYSFFVQSQSDYLSARKNCETHGGSLLRIDSLNEHQFISNRLNDIAVNRSVRWYTAGVMRPDSFGEFMWEGHPVMYQNVRSELMSLWLDIIPRPSERPSFPKDRTRLVYGTDRNRWGWYLDTPSVRRGHICRAPVANANQLLSISKSLAYGSDTPYRIARGPCFIIHPKDVLYVHQMSSEKYAELRCEANGNPQPTYRWYYVSTDMWTNSTGSTMTILHRILSMRHLNHLVAFPLVLDP